MHATLGGNPVSENERNEAGLAFASGTWEGGVLEPEGLQGWGGDGGSNPELASGIRDVTAPRKPHQSIFKSVPLMSSPLPPASFEQPSVRSIALRASWPSDGGSVKDGDGGSRVPRPNGPDKGRTYLAMSIQDTAGPSTQICWCLSLVSPSDTKDRHWICNCSRDNPRFQMTLQGQPPLGGDSTASQLHLCSGQRDPHTTT